MTAGITEKYPEKSKAMRTNTTRIRAAVVAIGCAMALVPLSPANAALPAPTANDAKARLIEFQRLGLTPDVDEQIARITELNAAEGAAWGAATSYWDNSLREFSIHGTEDPTSLAGVPDGLPNDRSHVFVTLGHVLNNDGTPQQQLIDRLQVAKAAATKYPNARIMVTGGYGASGQTNVTEGEVMRDWLIGQGVAADRIIPEMASFDTPNNASFSMDILYGLSGADAVSSVSIITAGWHMRRGTVLYEYATRLKQLTVPGHPVIEVKAHAACVTSECQNSDYVLPSAAPNQKERNLIAQNVAKLAGTTVGGSDGNGGLYRDFQVGTAGIRYAAAKNVYFQREGFDGNDANPRNNTLDLARAIDESGDVSNTLKAEWPELTKKWDAALRPWSFNTSVPAGLPTSGHAFVMMGAADGTENTAQAKRMDLARDALVAYPNSLLVVAGNQAEINVAETGLATRGVPESRIRYAPASTSAALGAINALDVLYSLKGAEKLSTYTLIVSGDYIRRPTALFAIADVYRKNAWRRADSPIVPVSHIVETDGGRTADANLPSAANRNQIIDNALSSIFEGSGELTWWTNNPGARPLSTLASLSVTAPAKTEYVLGEAYDPAGLKVEATLNNGTVRTIDITDLVTVPNPSLAAVGTQQVEVAYTYRGTTRTASFPVTVRTASVTSLQESIDAAADLVPTDYTPASYAAVTSAIAAAQIVVNDINSTPTQAQAALGALQAALDGLVEAVPTVQIVLSAAAVAGRLDPGTTATVIATPTLSERPITSIEYATGGAWQPYSGPVTLPNGAYQFQARATDSAGKVSAVASVAVDVRPATITPKVTAKATNVRFGKSAVVTITAKAGTSAVNGGTVTVRRGTTALGSARVVKGSAKVRLSAKLAVGKHSISVSYAPAAGPALRPVTVARAATVVVSKTAVKSVKAKRTKGVLTRGKRATIRVRLGAVQGVAPAGRVTVRVGGKAQSSAKVRKAGKYYQATVTIKRLKNKGKVSLVYSGSKTYLKSTASTKLRVR